MVLMLNISGSELAFLLLIALVVFGPEQLPEAVRRASKAYGEFKKMTSRFQAETRSTLEEPVREMRETADAMRKAANLDWFLSYTFWSRLPDPSRLVVPTRPGVVRAAPTLACVSTSGCPQLQRSAATDRRRSPFAFAR